MSEKTCQPCLNGNHGDCQGEPCKCNVAYDRKPRLASHAKDGLCPETGSKCPNDCVPFDCNRWNPANPHDPPVQTPAPSVAPAVEQALLAHKNAMNNLTCPLPNNSDKEWNDAIKTLDALIAAALAQGRAEQADEVARLKKERDEFRALASVGTWHKDCRPNRHKAAEEIEKSQVRINQLADEVTRLSSLLAQREQES